MKYEQLANEIYWAMEHGELSRVDQLIEDLMTTQYINPSPTKLENMSMEELARLAKNQGEDKALRYQALQMLNRRERKFFAHHSYYPVPVYNYVDDL